MPNEDISKYREILELPRHVSATRQPMSLHDRAAQFSPFAALTGYEDELRETARQVQKRSEITEEVKEKIDRELRYLSLHLEEEPQVKVTYFVCDRRKDGGAYVTEETTLKKIDTVRLALVLTDGRKIPIDDIEEIRSLNK